MQILFAYACHNKCNLYVIGKLNDVDALQANIYAVFAPDYAALAELFCSDANNGKWRWFSLASIIRLTIGLFLSLSKRLKLTILSKLYRFFE